jgi:hypothetical protein
MGARNSDRFCRTLNRYRNNEVTIRTESGDIIMGELLRVRKDCCAEILEHEIVSPFVSDRLTVVRCSSIESFSVELPL